MRLRLVYAGDTSIFLQNLVGISAVFQHNIGKKESKSASGTTVDDIISDDALASTGPEHYLPFTHIYESTNKVVELNVDRPRGAPRGMVVRDCFDAFFNLMFQRMLLKCQVLLVRMWRENTSHHECLGT